MARVSTYLNFLGNTEEAFAFYKEAFGTDYHGDIARMGDMPADPNMPALSDRERQAILHIELPITGGHMLMGTDALESMGHTVSYGNAVHINLEPDSRAETDRLFTALSDGAMVTMPLQDMFWGAYFGSLTDRYGVSWMFNFAETAG